jgi:hypothetical protein
MSPKIIPIVLLLFTILFDCSELKAQDQLERSPKEQIYHEFSQFHASLLKVHYVLYEQDKMKIFESEIAETFHKTFQQSCPNLQLQTLLLRTEPVQVNFELSASEYNAANQLLVGLYKTLAQ